MTKPSPHRRAEHKHRMQQAVARLSDIEEWCADRDITFTVRNEGHHWAFQSGEDRIVEWWPSSGLCIVARNFNSRRNVNNWKRLIPVLDKALRRVVEPVQVAAPVLDESEDETLDDWSAKAFDWDAEVCPFEAGVR